MKKTVLSVAIYVILLFPLFASAQHQVRQVREGSSYIGALYMTGDLIQSGFNIHYLNMTRGEESKLEYGYGFAINYFDVKNTDDNLEGAFFGYSPQLAVNFYLNEGPAQFVIGGSVLIVFGSESINNSYTTTTNFFIGPQLKETVGIKLADTLVLKAGLLQLWHFGSDLLPSDTGSFAGIDVAF